jgi:hypothetical protein
MKRSTITKVSAGTAALLLAVQGLLNGLNMARKGSCELFVDNAHESTYTRTNNMGNNLKINARTECDKTQLYSEVKMTVYEVVGSNSQRKQEFPLEKAVADKKNPQNAYFTNFKSICIGHRPIKYFGTASGTVKLKNGKTVKVNGKSSKTTYVDCVINAK